MRVDVAIDADVDVVCAALDDEARKAVEIESVEKDPAPSAAFSPGVVDGALAFTVSCMVADYAKQDGVANELRKRVVRRLRRDNIALAPPRR